MFVMIVVIFRKGNEKQRIETKLYIIFQRMNIYADNK